MSTGTVVTIKGAVTIIKLDGTEEALKVGDSVKEGEIIVTGAYAAVQIVYPDGSIMDLGRDSRVAMSDSLLENPDESAKQAGQTPEEAKDEVAAIQKALASEEDFDPSKLPATAAGVPGAGGADGNNGHSSVQIDYLKPDMTPENGFDTTGPTVGFLDPLGELILEPVEPVPEVPEIPEIPNTPPTADEVLTEAERGGEVLPEDLKAALETLNDTPAEEVILALSEASIAQVQVGNEFGVVFFKEFDINGLVGDSDFGDASMGGVDTETNLENLTFTLTSLPDIGTLILIDSDGNPSIMQVGDTFDSTDTIWWYATEGDINQFEGGLPDDVSFGYLVTDEGGLTDSATVTIGFPNDFPVAGDSEITVDEDGLNNGIAAAAAGDVADEITVINDTLDYDFGLDGVGDVDFASLHEQIVQATGDSGLQNLTSQGNPITYVWDGATHTLTGVANLGGEGEYDVFTLEITDISTGDYTFTLLEQVDHPTAGTEDDLVLNLPFTVTDGNGDSVTGSVQVTIDDDSPVASITDVAESTVTVDESAGLQDDDTTDAEVIALFAGLTGFSTDLAEAQYATSASSLVDTSGTSVGADDEDATATVATVLSLSVTNGNSADSGLETTDGTQIFLYEEDGLVVGRIGTEDGDTDTADADGEIAFAISLNADGTVSMVQYASVTNPTFPDDYDETADLTGEIDAVITVTDGDGDTATSSTAIGDQILFSDDGPTASITDVAESTVTVDESAGLQDDDTTNATIIALFAGLAGFSTDLAEAQYATSASSLVDTSGTSVGADDEGATTVLSLSVTNGNSADSGLETTDGTQIFLYEEDGLVVGRIGTEDGDIDTADADGEIAFAISLNADGTVSMVQYASITNPTGGASHDETADLTGEIDAVVTVTDGDGDIDTATTAIGDQILFSDDGPVAGTAQTGILTYEVGNSLTADLNISFGADEEGKSLQLLLVEGAQVVDKDGVALTINDGTTLVWSFDENAGDMGVWSAVDSTDPTNVIFTVELNDDSTYTIELLGLLDGVEGTFEIILGSGLSGGNDLSVALFDVDVPNNSTEVPVDATRMLYIEATDESGAVESVNTSANYIGIGTGQRIANGVGALDDDPATSEELQFWFAVPSDPALVTDPAIDLMLQSYNFVQIDLNALDIGETGFWEARFYDDTLVFGDPGVLKDADDKTYLLMGSGEMDGIVSGGSSGSDEIFIIDQDGSNDTNADGLYVGGTVTGDFNSIVLTAEDGTSYKVAGVSGTIEQDGSDFDLTFDVLATDGDGDTTTTSFDVTLDAEGDVTGTSGDDVITNGSEGSTLSGLEGNDILSGLAGDDILIGGAGDDIMTGGLGADTFVWNAGEVGTDSITDFMTGGSGDVLDIADLLIGEDGLGAAALDGDYISISSDGTNTTVTLYSSGDGATNDQTIVLEGVDLLSGGISSQDAIQNLLNDGNLITD